MNTMPMPPELEEFLLDRLWSQTRAPYFKPDGGAENILVVGPGAAGSHPFSYLCAAALRKERGVNAGVRELSHEAPYWGALASRTRIGKRMIQGDHAVTFTIATDVAADLQNHERKTLTPLGENLLNRSSALVILGDFRSNRVHRQGILINRALEMGIPAVIVFGNKSVASHPSSEWDKYFSAGADSLIYTMTNIRDERNFINSLCHVGEEIDRNDEYIVDAATNLVEMLNWLEDENVKPSDLIELVTARTVTCH
ncbi:hypothetical protein IOD40_18940 [Aquamicrobium sp. cd-1]|uniref:Uncharacterized protein n=2 Tax=Aquamicrobium zhengzhouense TaxID=2781738 RepID=A0ABS0SJA2_9HYPH|nr:hypothetical protein [Aquamicrobium zhengzhouense]